MKECLIIAARGKKGHERQAVAVAMRLGLAPIIVEVEDGSPRPRVSPDVALVLAAGRQAIAAARAIARLPGRPPVAVLQPVRRPREFDLVWAPLHDRGLFAPRDGRLETLTAPSAVTAEERVAGARWLDGRTGSVRPVGVLVGGATGSHRFGVAEAEQLAVRLVAFADTHGATLAVTTSRRTGATATAILRARLAQPGSRHLLVDGALAGASLAYGGIIERATAFIATSDSVAMLSDAATTGKPILGWRLPGARSKFERFYRGLAAHGALRWFDGRLEYWTYRPLDAAAVIADALRPMLLLPDAAVQHT